ncbi:MAG TPA: flagellar M-ring protein FliF [Clostridiales bacterium]|nr:flagellar M-ring protein FliF [Clostridiales bacterium]
MTVIKSIMNKIGDFFKKTERKKIILLSVSAATVLAIVIIGTVLLNRVEYTVLYSGLNADEAGTIMTLLQEKGVPAKVKGTDTILVSEEQADEVRIELASQGYPNTGLNYDIFGYSSNMGSTDLERQTYLQYQLQENMRATIRRMNKVEDCIVIVNLASKSSFVVSSNNTEASVAVLLSLEPDAELSLAEAKAIAQFVMKCVPDLKMENISIVDSKMNHYDILSEDAEVGQTEYSALQQELTDQMKATLTDQVLRVLEPALGKGNVAVTVNLRLNFDKEIVSSVEFFPPIEGNEKGLIRSSEELYEAMGDSADIIGAVGTDSNGVSDTEYVYRDEEGNNRFSESSSRIYNYELNQIQTQIEKAQGAVEDLSVAVLVNNRVEGAAGNLDKVENLVSAAIGVDRKYISAEALPFVESAGELDFDDYFQQNQDTLRRISRNNLIRTVIILVAIPVIALIIIHALRRKGRSVDEFVGAGDEFLEFTADEPLNDESEEFDIDQLLKDLGTGRSPAVERIVEMVDRYPETVVQVLRTWLSEDD